MTAASGVLRQGNLDRCLWPPPNASWQYHIATDLCLQCEQVPNASQFLPLVVDSSRMDTERTGHILPSKLHAALMSLDDVLRCCTESAVLFGWRWRPRGRRDRSLNRQVKQAQSAVCVWRLADHTGA